MPSSNYRYGSTVLVDMSVVSVMAAYAAYMCVRNIHFQLIAPVHIRKALQHDTASVCSYTKSSIVKIFRLTNKIKDKIFLCKCFCVAYNFVHKSLYLYVDTIII